MKQFLAFFLFMGCAIPLTAQTVITQQRCYEQACAYSSWNPNKAGDLLVIVIRAQQKVNIPCESTQQQCGGYLFLVSDLVGNDWHRAYSSWTSEVWYALDAKPELNIVGVMASHGYDGAGENSTGGDFAFDVLILEYPPAIGLDSSAWNEYYKGNGDDEPKAGPVDASTSNTLLIGWTNNLEYNNAKGPLTMTPDSPFRVVSDDGVLAVADSLVTAPGSYSFSGAYNGYCLWTGGIVAFKMGAPQRHKLSPKPIGNPHNDHTFEKQVPNENEPKPNSNTVTLKLEEKRITRVAP